ncbi:acyl-CoA reductase [Limibacter armeniacum]|uniref:acyl-CoA reductase n=1 Tax=Limibacter armeniacum TaxID=466084 RepID=UPI002FE59B94
MTLKERVEAFAKLGQKISNLTEDEQEMVLIRANSSNGWFDEQSVLSALKGIGVYLNQDALDTWVAAYDIPDTVTPKSVLVIMAGNIPMVGFHDALSTLISGHKLVAKISSQDTYLMPWLLETLIEIEPAFKDMITITEGRAEQIEAVIATGSDNSARYFEQYFGKYPNIIRKNRSSVAVIRGDEDKDVLAKLKDDILMYYGLGCRNISKVFIPSSFNINLLLEALEPFAIQVRMNHKYQNNYDYNKSIYLVNKVPHLDNGGIIFRESEEMVSPISVVYYEKYENGAELKQKLDEIKEKTQCVVSSDQWLAESYNFGQAQFPALHDYADGVDTLKFLIELN